MAARTAALPFTPEQRLHELYMQREANAPAMQQFGPEQTQLKRNEIEAQRAVGLAPFSQGQGNLAMDLKRLDLLAAQQEPSPETQRRTGLTQMASEALATGQPLPDVLGQALGQEYQPPSLLPPGGQGLPATGPLPQGQAAPLPGGASSPGGVMQGLSAPQRTKVEKFIADEDAPGLERYLRLTELPIEQINALLKIASGSQRAKVGQPTGWNWLTGRLPTWP
jgi:hypothetical protein